MPDWLTQALDAAAPLEAGASRLIHIFGAVHNEMTSGSGTSAPASITQALLDSAEEILAALGAAPAPTAAVAVTAATAAKAAAAADVAAKAATDAAAAAASSAGPIPDPSVLPGSSTSSAKVTPAAKASA
jgi:hypothetical protein